MRLTAAIDRVCFRALAASDCSAYGSTSGSTYGSARAQARRRTWYQRDIELTMRDIKLAMRDIELAMLSAGRLAPHRWCACEGD